MAELAASGHVRRLAQVVAESGVAVEVSSSGLAKPGAEIYPSPSLLARLAQRGVAFTTASDAHGASRIGANFAQLRAALSELTTFSHRTPAPHALSPEAG